MCSPQQAPAAEQKAVTELPEWAKPYGKDILAKGAALTDINQNPYQTYNQERLAGFSPMQQQAMQGAAAMQPSQQVSQGSGLAYGAGLGGLGMAMGATPQNFQSQVGGYMNPYLQMSLAPQLAEANRAYDIGATKQQSAATQAGAFGGSREAIMAAENERNRNMGLQSIIGQGYNTAYNQAQNQYNQAQQQALQGLGVGLQGASTLGQLGQTQYGQQMGINQLQAQYGGQQQAQMQKGLDTSYQDFLNQQNYPYKQLGFMSDLLRGTPTGSSSVTQMYQAPPSALQTVGALGMGAYGAKQLGMFAEGGSVTSEGNVQSIIEKLSPEQLQQAKQTALARRDMQTVEAIDQRLAELASEKSISQGIAGAMPQQMADGVANAAGGGILAFNDRGLVDESEGSQSIQIPQQAGDPELYRKFGERALKSIDAYSKVEAPRAYTPQEEEALDARSLARAQKLVGPSPIAGIKAELEDLKTQSTEALKQGKGLAALAAMEGMLQPGGALRGLGRAGKNFAEAYAPAVKADQDLRRSTATMNINLANAQRAENMGLAKEAMSYTNQAIQAKKESAKAERELAKAEAELNVSAAKAFRPPAKGAGGGAGGKPKPFDILNEAALAYKKDPSDANRMRLEAAQESAQMVYSGTAPAQVGAQTAADKALAKVRYTKGFKDWAKSNYGGDMMEAEKAFIASQKAGTLPKIFSNLTAAPAAAPAPAAKPKDEKAKSTPSVLRFDAKGNPITD